MVVMVIMAVSVASVKSFIGIFTHQGYISKVNANAYSVTHSVTNITSIASCDAKNIIDEVWYKVVDDFWCMK